MEHTMSIKTRLVISILKALRFLVVPQNPKSGKWYRIPLPDCVAGNGKEYHGSFRIGTENKLMVMFHGGGVSWNEYMAARPNSLYTQPDTINFYGTDSDPIADLATGHGISSNKKSNPFRDWSVISVPYSSGDFHCGTNDFPYSSVDGTPSILYHHGYTNYRAVMAQAMKYINTSPEQIVVTGFSAGGFGTALLTDDVMRLFPECKNVICYVDSGFMLYPGWHDAAKHIWKAPSEIVERIHTDNITLDCLQALKRDHRDKVKVLFSCSVRDANLAEFIPFVQNGVFGVDKQAGISFQHELSQMCQQLMETIPDVGIYIFDQPIQGKENAQKRSDGLTTHCIGLSNLAETLQIDGCTVQEWVWAAVKGEPRKIGLSLLEHFPDE